MCCEWCLPAVVANAFANHYLVNQKYVYTYFCFFYALFPVGWYTVSLALASFQFSILRSHSLQDWESSEHHALCRNICSFSCLCKNLTLQYIGRVGGAGSGRKIHAQEAVDEVLTLPDYSSKGEVTFLLCVHVVVMLHAHLYDNLE